MKDCLISGVRNNFLFLQKINLLSLSRFNYPLELFMYTLVFFYRTYLCSLESRSAHWETIPHESYLPSRGSGCICFKLSFQGCLTSEQSWKTEEHLPSACRAGMLTSFNKDSSFLSSEFLSYNILHCTYRY